MYYGTICERNHVILEFTAINKFDYLNKETNIEPKKRKNNDILYFKYSKKLYDEEIIKIVKILYEKIYNK